MFLAYSLDNNFIEKYGNFDSANVTKNKKEIYPVCTFCTDLKCGTNIFFKCKYSSSKNYKKILGAAICQKKGATDIVFLHFNVQWAYNTQVLVSGFLGI